MAVEGVRAVTTEARAAGRSAKYADQAAVFRVALTTMLRGVALIVGVVILIRVHENANIVFDLAATAIALACLFFALGRVSIGLAVYVVAFGLFVQLRSWADEIGMPVQYQYPVTADKLFGSPVKPLQDAFYTYGGRVGPVDIYSLAIYFSYFSVPHLSVLALWKFDRKRFSAYVPAFLIVLLIGITICALVPTAPPWLAAQDGEIPTVYRILADIGGDVAPGAFETGYTVAGVNPVAAMPSLHVAIPCLMAVALWKYRIWRWVGVWYAASMWFAVMYMGEHYFVDGLAGLGVALFGWWAASALVEAWRKRQPLTPAVSDGRVKTSPATPDAVTVPVKYPS